MSTKALLTVAFLTLACTRKVNFIGWLQEFILETQLFKNFYLYSGGKKQMLLC